MLRKSFFFIIMNRPFLSIIIPVYNEAVLIPLALSRLQIYRQAGHELIVVDGHSEDNSFTEAQAWADKVVKSPKGRGKQLHSGALVAQGQVLLFLHIDTELPQDADAILKQQLNASSKHWGRFRVRLQGEDWRLKMIAHMMNWRSCLTGMVTGDQTLFVRRQLYFEIGGFPPLPLMEDLAISRLLKAQGRVLCLSASVKSSARRWQQQGLVKTVLLMWLYRFLWWLGLDEKTLARWYYNE